MDCVFKSSATYSVHWLKHAGFKQAVKRFLIEESVAIRRYRDEMSQALPFRQIGEQ